MYDVYDEYMFSDIFTESQMKEIDLQGKLQMWEEFAIISLQQGRIRTVPNYFGVKN